MTERLTPSGTAHRPVRAVDPVSFWASPISSAESSHHTPLPDGPALLTRPPSEAYRETPSALNLAARRLAAWRNDPSQRPEFPCSPTSLRSPVLSAAVSCPDLFLLEAPLGAERLQIIVALAEVARAAGQRLAIVTANAANANAVALALPADGVGRAVAPGETALPPALAPQTARALAERESQVRVAAWLVQKQNVAKQLVWWSEWESLQRKEAEGHSDSPALLAIQTEHAAGMQTLRNTEQSERQALAVVEGQLAHPREAVAGLGSFVKKLFGSPKADPAVAALEKQRTERRAALERATQAIAAAEVEHRLQIEFRNSAERAARTERFNLERDRLESHRPADSRESIESRLREIEFQLAAVAEPIPQIPPREAAARLGIIVGPLAAIENDPFFALTHPETEPPFQRVLFADAEELFEHDFARVTRLAPTWVLLGSSDGPKPDPRNVKPYRGDVFRECVDSVDQRVFRREGNRFIARLGPAATNLRREPLADNPAIELRFRDLPGDGTELVEVAFPARFDLCDAKRFLNDELASPRAEFLGRPRWIESEAAIRCHWFDGGFTFDLTAGIRESLLDGLTAELHFDRAAGWTIDSARSWFAEHLQHQTAARVARMSPLR